MLAFLHVVLWITALRHALRLCKLGISDALVLHQFAREHRSKRSRSPWLGVWLSLSQYSRLFRPAVLLPVAKLSKLERLRQLHRTLDKFYAGHKPARDPLKSLRAKRLQANLIQRAFLNLFGLQLDWPEAFAIAGYGSPGIAARDFLTYCSDCGWSNTPLEVPLRLFIHESEIRHARVAGRRRVLHLLRLNIELQREMGGWRYARAAWYAAERMLYRVYWSAEDRDEHELRLAGSRKAHRSGSATIATPLREAATSRQVDFLILLAYEMHWQAVEVLTELSAEKPKSQANTERFTTAFNTLERNLESVVADYFEKEN